MIRMIKKKLDWDRILGRVGLGPGPEVDRIRF